MALTALDRVNKGFDALRKGLAPFVARELDMALGSHWEVTALQTLPPTHYARTSPKLASEWDLGLLLALMQGHWATVFKKTLGHSERAYSSLLLDARNRAAHQNGTNVFTTDEAYRTLDAAEQLLLAVAAGEEAAEAETQKSELMRIRFEESARKKVRRLEAAAPVTDAAASGLPPWKDVVSPHPDVASGRFQQAEFAADLWQVYQGGGKAGEYSNPADFFQRTLLTGGIKGLLLNALRRLNGDGGDPILNLQTNFGGGKTHSLLALYHLCSGADLTAVHDLQEFFRTEAKGLTPPARVNKAVVVGTRITPGVPHRKTDGTVVHTLWGEIAWQLGGPSGYALVQKSDEAGTNPGDALDALFRQTAPCLVLIDEWVAYARQLHEVGQPIGGSYGTQISFAQALCEAAKGVPEALVVISLPESDIEMGGDAGLRAAGELRSVVSRTESPWSSATTEESFKIVTRRLFSPLTDKAKFEQRDVVARGFYDLYQQNRGEFPADTQQADYRQQLADYYPIHPELFALLADNWASIPRFQKTRGILRLMAKIIHLLWDSDDASPLILPGHIPMDDAGIQEEMMRYLDEPWRAVIHKDVDGATALPRLIDKENLNLGRLSATRKVARALFFGSAPMSGASQRGLDKQRLKLGSVVPGQSVPVFNDALRYLVDRATYVYCQNNHYWYSTQNNVNRTAEERAGHVGKGEVEDYLKTLVDTLLKGGQSKLRRYHVMPASGADIADDQEMKLVVLGSDFAHSAREQNSPAQRRAEELLVQYRGTGSRMNRNTLVFLAPDKARIQELHGAVKNYLGWQSVKKDEERLNLDGFQKKQVDQRVAAAKDAVKSQIPTAFACLLSPTQVRGSRDIEWNESRLNGSAQDTLLVRITNKLINQSQVYDQFNPTELRMSLDDDLLWRGNNHIPLKTLKEDFVQYLYLARLLEVSLLPKAIEQGLRLSSWEKDSFAYADSYDEAAGRYRGLVTGATNGVERTNISMDGAGLLVKAEVAAQQQVQERAEEAERARLLREQQAGQGESKPYEDDSEHKEDRTGMGGAGVKDSGMKRTRFFADAQLDATRFFRDAEALEKEIIKHLPKGATVTMHIEARNADGFPLDLQRVLQENMRTLGLGSAEFED